MKMNIGKYELEIQDTGAPRGERNFWYVNLNGVELYADHNGKRANALFDAVLRVLQEQEARP